MRAVPGILAIVASSACGSDRISSDTAAVSRADTASRDAAQARRIDNPQALACIRSNSSDGEWRSILQQDASAAAMFQSVLNRQGTIRCFNENNVVIHL